MAKAEFRFCRSSFRRKLNWRKYFSGTLSKAPQLCRLLRHVVETTLRGETSRLKESLIGIEVLGLKPGFDPRIDPKVRTEAVRLRKHLARYYRDEGGLDPVVIDLPKGGYVAAFKRRPRRSWFSSLGLALVSLAIVLLAGPTRPVDANSAAVIPFESLGPHRRSISSLG